MKKSYLLGIPEKQKTKKMCLEAVKRNGNDLCLVPEKYRTREMCLIAVKYDPWNLETVHDAKGLLTKEMCEIAVKKAGRCLDFVPDKWRTPELCLEAVKQNSGSLCYVPEIVKDKMILSFIKEKKEKT